MREKQRASVAIALCLTSGLAGVAGICLGGHASRAWTTFGIACVWTYTADWLGHRLRLLSIPLGKPLLQAMESPGAELRGTARAISLGDNVLLGAAIIAWLAG